MLTEQDILEAIVKDEHEKSEFKSAVLKDGDLAEYIMAFAHKDGGCIYIGIDQKTKQITGKTRTFPQSVLDGVNHAACDCLSPEVANVSTEDVIAKGKHVLVVKVPKSSRIHQHRNGKILIRRGAENVAYTGQSLEQAILRSRDFAIGFDGRPLLSASSAHIDYSRVQLYVNEIIKRRPDSGIKEQPLDHVLKSIGAIEELEGIYYPTTAGLLFFNPDPQAFLPQARVTFLRFAGTDVASGDGRGGLYLVNQELRGTLPDIIETAQSVVLENMRKRSIMNGFKRDEIPEYPSWAIREAIINAVAHRDYSISGAKTQISMFSDRIEIQSPGGLPGHITIENIEKEQFTRNQKIMRLLEEFGFVEERGIGIDNMIRSMRESGLEPPMFQDSGSSVTVPLKNTTLLDDETITWLNRLGDVPIDKEQKMALAYMRRNSTISNRIYQQINNVDNVKATRDLSDLVLLGLLKQHGTRGGAYYTCTIDITGARSEAYYRTFRRIWSKDESKILRYVSENKRIDNSECRELLKTNAARSHYLLKTLVDAGILRPIGERKARYYVLTKRPSQLSLWNNT
jgi:ATP-dependent DNA helicase RecG